MREILFRGKRTINGDWVEGNLFIPDLPNTPTQILIGTNIYRIPYDVIPSTVGQYTGLTDKNGTKIFEGDILNTSNSNCRIWYVDYKNTAFCANQGNANYSCVLDEFMQYSSVEVIGNIHDSPELMKGAGQ